MSEDQPEFNLGAALGAGDNESSFQRFAIYIPNKDKQNNPVNVASWIELGLYTLLKVNSGCTALPAAIGRYKDEDESGVIVEYEEDTVIIYSFIFDPAAFEQNIHEIKAFVHTFGRETNQKAVMCEIIGEGASDGVFYSRAYMVKDFDPPPV